MQKLIYVASPYSANPPVNYKQVFNFVVKHKIENNEVLFSPIVYSHHIALAMDYEKNKAFAAWQDFDLMMLSKADELWVLMIDGWSESVGVKKEIEFILEKNKHKRNKVKIKYIEV